MNKESDFIVKFKWLIVLAGCLTGSFIERYFGDGMPSNLSGAIGSVVGGAVAIYAFAMLACVWVKGRAGTFVGLSVIIMMVSLFLYNDSQTNKAKITVNSMKSAYNQAASSDGHLRKLSDANGMVIDEKSSTDGDYGEGEVFLRKTINRFADINSNYYREFNSTNIKDLLNWNRLIKDSDFLESHKMISNAKDVVFKYREISFNAQKQVFADVDLLNASQEFKNSIIQGYADGTSKQNFNVSLWSLQIERIDLLSTIIDFLQRTKSKWSINNNNNIVFQNNTDLITFNDYVKKYQRLNGEEAAIIDVAHSRAIKSLNDIKTR